MQARRRVCRDSVSTHCGIMSAYQRSRCQHVRRQAVRVQREDELETGRVRPLQAAGRDGTRGGIHAGKRKAAYKPGETRYGAGKAWRCKQRAGNAREMADNAGTHWKL